MRLFERVYGDLFSIMKFRQARDQLIAKYGREFALAAMDNRNEVVNSRVGINPLYLFFDWTPDIMRTYDPNSSDCAKA